MRRLASLSILFLLLSACSHAAPPPENAGRQHWVDSLYNRLSEDERIGQLFMVAAYSGGEKTNVPEIEKLIRAHQIGGLIFMQGGPVRQATLTNRYQQMAQVPLLIAMDAEWGLGMRLDSVINFPRQMQLGATDDSGVAYVMGMAIANQCKRLGVHINFAPVVDVNNNPDNPVINSRSFGENKERVARLAIGYMRGMQDNGVMACAKHFPGHGDVAVDSHKDLPVINKSRAQLDALELYPFRELIRAGVQSVMVAHLSVPSLETEAHVPTTLSKNTVTGLLKNELGFKGLVFTDALNMQGVAKYFAAGDADVRAFIAGNDVLLFSQDVPTAIAKIRAAIKGGKVSGADLATRVKKILAAKWDAGLARVSPISTANIRNDLNDYTRPYNMKVAEKAITVVRDRAGLTKLKDNCRILHIRMNIPAANVEGGRKLLYPCYYQGFDIDKTTAAATTAAAMETKMNNEKWDVVLVEVGAGLNPGNHYGLDDETLRFLNKVKSRPNVIVAVMGNAYALQYVCDAPTLICAYEDTPWTDYALEELIAGKIKAKGKLPVTPDCLK